MANLLQWILEKKGVCEVIHYQDDYLFLGEPSSIHCRHSLQLALDTCQRLGVEVSMKKLEGPVMKISFLGVTLDSEWMEVCLPQEKMERLSLLIAEWRGRNSSTKRELLSLLGILHHACKVVRPGRSFLRRMIRAFQGGREASSPHSAERRIQIKPGVVSYVPTWLEWDRDCCLVSDTSATLWR